MIPVRLKTGLWIVPIVVAVGCVRSEKPLIDEEASKIDADLIGEWRLPKGKNSVSFSIRQSNSDSLLELADGDERFDLLMLKIGDDRYVCTECFNESRAYMIFHYAFYGGSEVRLYELDDGVIRRAIKNKQLVGKVWPGSDAEISDTPEAMRAFLKGNGTHCFKRHYSLSFERNTFKLIGTNND